MYALVVLLAPWLAESGNPDPAYQPAPNSMSSTTVIVPPPIFQLVGLANYGKLVLTRLTKKLNSLQEK